MASAAAVNQVSSEPDEICREIESLNRNYDSALLTEFSNFDEWFEKTMPLILTMYTFYLVNPAEVLRCLGIDHLRVTETAQRTLRLLPIIQNVDNYFNGMNGPLPPGVGMNEILELGVTSGNVSKFLAQQLFVMKMGVPQIERGKGKGKRKTMAAPQTVQSSKRQRSFKGGAMNDASKKALANILVSIFIVGGATSLYFGGGMAILTKKLVTLFNPVFIDNSHCLGIGGYYLNKISSSVGMSKACSAISAENSAAADFVVQKVQLTLTGMGITASLGFFAFWNSLQNAVINYVINPMDSTIDYLKARGDNVSPLEKIIMTQITTSGMVRAEETRGLSQPEIDAENTFLNNADSKLYFNETVQRNATTGKIEISATAGAALKVLPYNTSEDVTGKTELNAEEKALYKEALTKTRAKIAEDASVAANAAAAASTSTPTPTVAPTTAAAATAAATSGGKKKRKTMKKKKKKKKKIHKKKRRKTVKKHHKKHTKKHHKKHSKKHHKKQSKKHNKKHGRKTRKH